MSLRSSGLRDLALPVGQNTQNAGQGAPTNIFHFTEIRKRLMCRRNPAQGRGAHRDRHERGPDGGGRGPHRREGFRRAGNRERRRRAYDRCGQRTVKSCGPGARGLCAKSCGDVAARPGPRISHLRGDGGNSASLPGESATYAVKPLRREGRLFGFTCMPLCKFLLPPFAQWTVGARPAPGLPCALFHWARRRSKARAKPAARGRKCVYN